LIFSKFPQLRYPWEFILYQAIELFMVPKSFQLSCLYSTCYTPKAVGPLYVVIDMWVTLIKSILDFVWDPSSNIWRHGGVTSSLIGVLLMVVFICVY